MYERKLSRLRQSKAIFPADGGLLNYFLRAHKRNLPA
jgi:hypothetical protein